MAYGMICAQTKVIWGLVQLPCHSVMNMVAKNDFNQEIINFEQEKRPTCTLVMVITVMFMKSENILC